MRNKPNKNKGKQQKQNQRAARQRKNYSTKIVKAIRAGAWWCEKDYAWKNEAGEIVLRDKKRKAMQDFTKRSKNIRENLSLDSADNKNHEESN